MKKLNYLLNGLAALAFVVLFSQCAGNTNNQSVSAPAHKHHTKVHINPQKDLSSLPSTCSFYTESTTWPDSS